MSALDAWFVENLVDPVDKSRLNFESDSLCLALEAADAELVGHLNACDAAGLERPRHLPERVSRVWCAEVLQHAVRVNPVESLVRERRAAAVAAHKADVERQVAGHTSGCHDRAELGIDPDGSISLAGRRNAPTPPNCIQCRAAARRCLMEGGSLGSGTRPAPGCRSSACRRTPTLHR
jgi:hypothetical protein